MKNKKLLIPAGICLAIRLMVIVEYIVFVIQAGGDLYSAFSVFQLTVEAGAFVCAMGAFVLDDMGKRRGAVICAVISLAEVFIRIVFLNLTVQEVLYGQAVTFSQLLQMVYIVPHVFLLIFVANKKRSRGGWLAVGIILTVLPICDSYSLPLYRLYEYRSLAQIAIYSLIIKLITAVPHGLVYLFGFMNVNNSTATALEEPTLSPGENKVQP